jgi:hypothetical protein
LRYQRTQKGREQHRLGQQRHRRRQTVIKASSDASLSAVQLQPPVDGHSLRQEEVTMPSVTDHLVSRKSTKAAATENRIVRLHQTLRSIRESQTVQCELCGAHCIPFAYRKSWRKRRRRKKRGLRLRCKPSREVTAS